MLKNKSFQTIFIGLGFVCSLILSGCNESEVYIPMTMVDDTIVIHTAGVQNSDPFEAGKQAATALLEKMGDTQPHTVIMTECFEDKPLKKKALAGITSVLPPDIVFGFSTYGTFSQQGCLDSDSVGLVGIGGGAVTPVAAIQRKLNIGGLTIENDEALLKERLNKAGAKLAAKLPKKENDKFVIVMADAHSPKNQFLVEGVQKVLGKDFPVTGGSANKNAGQTFVYFQGKMYTDSAIAIMLSGDFEISMSGRQAKENAMVISTAGDGAKEAMGKMKKKPFAVFAYNCAGRKGKLDNIKDELDAMQKVLGRDIPLFGSYCAGEIGPADMVEKDPEALSSGVGWHVMFTVLGR